MNADNDDEVADPWCMKAAADNAVTSDNQSTYISAVPHPDRTTTEPSGPDRETSLDAADIDQLR